KPYDLLAKEKYIVGNEKKTKLIKNITLDNASVMVGEKVNINVESNEKILYRFWIQGKQDWELIRDYNLDNALIYTATKEGRQEILVECKKIDSKENFDEFMTVRFDVLPHIKIEISDFKCLTDNLLINEDLTFKVEANLGDKRSLLYKFVKINSDGKTTCIQDYSSRKIVTYQESEAGSYKLLCMVRDILSNKDYDDRALILYDVKPYNKVKIKKFTSHVNSPQVNGSSIFLKADARGGNELVYRYIVNGPIAEDTGYIRRNEFLWETKKEGEYDITLYVKDVSFEGDYEAKESIMFTIDKKAEKPAKIVDVILDSKKVVLVGQPVNIKVMAEGEINLQYSFIVYKDNVETERIDFGTANWSNFTPEEKGDYEIEIRVKNKFSTMEYDSHTFVYLTAKEYLPGEIDYVLFPQKDVHLVGEIIEIETVTENTKSVLLRYVTKINGHLVEDTDFIENKKIQIKPKCAGKYVFEVYAKNVKCEKEFDSKKELTFYVSEASPVTGTKVICEKDDIEINKEVTFKAISNGGKDVCYEFYIMEKGNWVKVQEYSKKHYYTFIPFVKGEYRVMVFAKSYYRKVKYEDYGEFTFNI
ncbi:triple tyrosine motif-containing protein, partial [Clostridium sp. HBUAS56017]